MRFMDGLRRGRFHNAIDSPRIDISRIEVGGV